MALTSMIFNPLNALILSLAASSVVASAEPIVPPMVNIPAGEFLMPSFSRPQ
ncbi:MAG: hypothetical protein OQJ95_06255 [Kangiella sp.]|nr:hypothetical protein [Kangiella sp.]MCW9029832.1 hypothetical protein [Kangiella sp.]